MAELILPQQLKSLFQLQFRLLQRAWSQPSALQKWGAVVGLLVTGGLAAVLGWVIGSLVVILGIYTREGPFQAQLVGYIFLVLLGLFGLFWLFSPLLFALQNDNLHLDLHKLLIYPLSFQSLYALHTLTGLIEPWSLFFYPLLIGLICGGVMVVGPSALAPLMILALLFGLLHVVWSRLLVNSLNSVLAHRRLRESAMLVLLLGIVVLAFLPALLGQQIENNPDWQSWVKSPAILNTLRLPLNLLLAFTPAGMASLALSGTLQGEFTQVYLAETGLFLWLVLGNYLGTSLLRQMYTSSPGVAEQASPSPRWWKSDLLFFLPYDLALMVKKDLRSLSRSVIGKLCFFLTPFLLVILRVFAFGPVAHNIPATAVLLSAITYIFMTCLFLFCNLFGLDGQGFKLYLYGSLSVNRLLLGKQLAMTFFCTAEFLLVLYLYLVLFNPLHWETLLFVSLAFATVLVGALGLGTLISIRFPTPLDLNQTRYRQSATPVLLAFQMLSLLLALPALAQVLAHFGQQPRSLIMAFLLGCVCLSHKLLFQFCTELFQAQKLEILEKISQPTQAQ